MLFFGTGCDGSSRFPSDEFAIDSSSAAEGRVDTRLDVSPGAQIQRFLLCPDESFEVFGETGVLLKELGVGEGGKLFDTRNGNVVEVVGLTSAFERVINLTGAEDEGVNVGFIVDDSREERLESGPREEFIDMRFGERVSH